MGSETGKTVACLAFIFLRTLAQAVLRVRLTQGWIAEAQARDWAYYMTRNQPAAHKLAATHTRAEQSCSLDWTVVHALAQGKAAMHFHSSLCYRYYSA